MYQISEDQVNSRLQVDLRCNACANRIPGASAAFRTAPLYLVFSGAFVGGTFLLIRSEYAAGAIQDGAGAISLAPFE